MSEAALLRAVRAAALRELRAMLRGVVVVRVGRRGDRPDVEIVRFARRGGPLAEGEVEVPLDSAVRRGQHLVDEARRRWP